MAQIRKYMAQSTLGLAALLLTCGAAPGQMTQAAQAAQTMPATAPAGEEDNPLVTATLQALERQGTALHDFTARIRYDSTDVRTADTETRDGTVTYRSDQGIVQFAVKFDRYRTSGLAPSQQNLAIIYDGQWLTVVDEARHTFTRNEMAPPGGSYNPLALDGPLPLPIGQKPADLRARFAITLVPADAELDPRSSAQVVHLQLVPRDAKAQGFRQVDLWIDRGLNLPIKAKRIELDDNSKMVLLRDVKENVGGIEITPPPTPAAGSGWNVTVERYGEKAGSSPR